MRTEIAVFVLNLSDIIFLRTAPHICWWCMVTFVICYDRINKTAVQKTIFVSEHYDTIPSQLTKCFSLVACFACCSIGDSS